MKKLTIDSIQPPILSRIKAGAFLIVKAGEKVNVMTIGWASVGFIWSKPIMTIAIRPTRYTYGIIELAKDFSVSIPTEGMKKAIEFCGSRSGRDCDKFKECNLKTFPSTKVYSPVLAIAGIHVECKIIYKSVMDSTQLIDEYQKLYPKKDYHTLYFGEIVECYSTDRE
jgi:flavin reductase (DIM6/NTAB) family NADH-FMN oxidoreductase RutF